MSRRTAAGLVAFVLLVVLAITAARLDVPYVTMSPGPTVNVLGDKGGDGNRPIVEVTGHKTYPTEGQLRLTTVSVTNPGYRLSLLEALSAWADREVAVLPYAAVYPPTSTAEEEKAESAAQMVSSQDTAIAAALTELGYDSTSYPEVVGVVPAGPSDGKLHPRDRIARIDGTRIDALQDVFDVLKKVPPGDAVRLRVERGEKRQTYDLTTRAADDDPNRAIIGVSVGTGYDFPFEVHVGIDDSIGGPSAGLMFALSVYDTLTPGALTGGKVIAGTGTIAADGTVGPIGGIDQKIVAAHDAGAKLFLVPPDNCDAAVKAPVDEDDIGLVRADSLHSALTSLKAYAADPSADLPRCPS